MKKITLLALILFAPSASAQDGAHWEDATEETLDAMAIRVLNRANRLSFETNHEYCGFIAFDLEKQIRATRPLRGSVDGCTPDAPEGWELIASYHTHGKSDPSAEPGGFELPSGDDIRSDFEEEVDGYVATPGGRLWYIDTKVDYVEDALAIQIGGPGTLLTDPAYEPGEIDTCNIPTITAEETEAIEAGDLEWCELLNSLPDDRL